MIHSGALLLFRLGAADSTLPAPSQADGARTIRRVAASVQLAAQEYRLGVTDGRITAPAEVDEARLFLQEAKQSALTLPGEAGPATAAA
ncbi:MAG TPA: hypothetical protein VFT84_12140, partial [Gemmatimonadales bacterium]|nr:hypothetical protein [Gemmatimonadales bacterium]